MGHRATGLENVAIDYVKLWKSASLIKWINSQGNLVMLGIYSKLYNTLGYKEKHQTIYVLVILLCHLFINQKYDLRTIS